jgi:hypothetical protein
VAARSAWHVCGTADQLLRRSSQAGGPPGYLQVSGACGLPVSNRDCRWFAARSGTQRARPYPQIARQAQLCPMLSESVRTRGLSLPSGAQQVCRRPNPCDGVAARMWQTRRAAGMKSALLCLGTRIAAIRGERPASLVLHRLFLGPTLNDMANSDGVSLTCTTQHRDAPQSGRA